MTGSGAPSPGPWVPEVCTVFRMHPQPSKWAPLTGRLPLLLNVFYFRETLFIVYELLRDNLYHIYKYIEECKLPR